MTPAARAWLVVVLAGMALSAWMTRYEPLPPTDDVVLRVWDRWTHRLCERTLDGSSHCYRIRLPASTLP